MRRKALCDLTSHPPNIHTQGDDQDLNHSPLNCCGLGENEIGHFGDIHVVQVAVYEHMTELIGRHFETEIGSVWTCWIFFISCCNITIFWNYPMFFASKLCLSLISPRKNEGTRCFFSCTMSFFMPAPV